MRNVVITEIELDLIHRLITEWFSMANGNSPSLEWHTVYGLRHSLPLCNKDMLE